MSDKVKFELEYTLKTSTKILYNMLATPSGLSEWFADDVNIRDGVYTFFWDGDEEQARLLTKKTNEFIKFQWLEDEEDGIDSYFEFRIKIDPLTKDVALMITDFAEEDEIDESSRLWDSQVDELKMTVGS
jgi:uncharacterized protein YndB with AHSA1/START domain